MLTQQRPRDDANAHPRARLSRDLTPANRITDEITGKSAHERRGNVTLINCSSRPKVSDFRYRCQIGYAHHPNLLHAAVQQIGKLVLVLSRDIDAQRWTSHT